MQLLSRLARALADETRLRILLALSQGESTVSDLSARLGLGQPRVSTHLALLRGAGLVSVRPSGRSRTYRLRAQRVTAAVRALRSLVPGSKGPVRSPGAGREVRRNSPVRLARSCYDHLAGVAGVGLLDALLRRRWLVPVRSGGRVRYALTPAGDRALGARAVDIARARRARRMFASGCLDWTERRPHLGGALGAAILSALGDAGVVERRNGSRILTLRRPVAGWLGARPSGAPTE